MGLEADAGMDLEKVATKASYKNGVPPHPTHARNRSNIPGRSSVALLT